MEIKKTIVTIFMVPTLNIDREDLKNNGFINGFIADVNRDVQYEDAIYLLFKPTDIDRFRLFLDNEYERTKAVIDDYDYEGGYVVVVYQLDIKYKSDFSLIRQSKYSKTSPAFQALFPKVIKLKKNGLHRDELSIQYMIFNKTLDLIGYWEDKFGVTFDNDQEVWEWFNPEEESLDFNKINKEEYVK